MCTPNDENIIDQGIVWKCCIVLHNSVINLEGTHKHSINNVFVLVLLLVKIYNEK